MAGGFIKLWRKTLDWGWFDDPPVLCFWIYCLLKASYKPTNYHGIDLEVGEFSASLSRMSEETGLSVDQVRRAIRALTESQEITKRIPNGQHVIKVLKYADYQGIEEGETPKESQRKPRRQSRSDPQDDTIGPSLYKKRRKKKEDISPYIPQGDKKKGDPDGTDDWYHFPYITDEVPD